MAELLDYLTLDRVRALILLCTALATLAGWLGFDGYQVAQQKDKQITNIVNYYYTEKCKEVEK